MATHCFLFRRIYFSLKHNRIVAEMNCFFGNVIMTVVDKHTLEPSGVAVDVVVDRFDFFVFPCNSTVADLDFIMDIMQLLVMDEEHFLLRAFSMA